MPPATGSFVAGQQLSLVHHQPSLERLPTSAALPSAAGMYRSGTMGGSQLSGVAGGLHLLMDLMSEGRSVPKTGHDSRDPTGLFRKSTTLHHPIQSKHRQQPSSKKGSKAPNTISALSISNQLATRMDGISISCSGSTDDGHDQKKGSFATTLRAKDRSLRVHDNTFIGEYLCNDTFLQDGKPVEAAVLTVDRSVEAGSDGSLVKTMAKSRIHNTAFESTATNKAFLQSTPSRSRSLLLRQIPQRQSRTSINSTTGPVDDSVIQVSIPSIPRNRATHPQKTRASLHYESGSIEAQRPFRGTQKGTRRGSDKRSDKCLNKRSDRHLDKCLDKPSQTSSSHPKEHQKSTYKEPQNNGQRRSGSDSSNLIAASKAKRTTEETMAWTSLSSIGSQIALDRKHTKPSYTPPQTVYTQMAQ
ncbi:hypothetical protein BASA60_005728 [Batrachochytrium salamandrivorans]|nr:hypothetical protein BASA60_005728 [Batrachochytrium salamandrivorans]